MNLIKQKITKMKRWMIVNGDNIERVMITFLIALTIIVGMIAALNIISGLIALFYEVL